MQCQSRQQLKFQALLAERAHFMRHNLTENERILWRQLSGKRLASRFVGRCESEGTSPTSSLPVLGSSLKWMIGRMSCVGRLMRVGTASFNGLGVACCGLMLNWYADILLKL
jgi:hypothetical protein